MHFLPGNAYGGIGYQVLDVSSRLERKRDYQNIVVMPDEEGGFADAVRDRGLEVTQLEYRIPKHFESLQALQWNLGWAARFLLSVSQIRRAIRRADPDIVHLNGLLLLQPGVAAALEDVDIVWYLVSDNIYPQWLVKTLVPFVNRVSTEVVLISESNREFYRQTDRDVSIIPGGVDVDNIVEDEVSDARIQEFWDTHRIDPGRPTVLTLAKTHKMKGQIYGIKALAHLNQDINYLIAGPKRDEEYVKTLRQTAAELDVEDQVYITGFVDDKFAALVGADVFLLPSIGEGTPLAIMEALALNLPIVATDVGGVSELLDDGNAGQLVPPKEPRAITRAVRIYLEDPDLATRHANAGYERVYAEYDIDTAVSRYEDVYERIT